MVLNRRCLCLCLCACVWEHSVLLFSSRSYVWLFLAVFSPEPLAEFNCLFFFPYSTCVHVCLPACHSLCRCRSLFLTETRRRSPKATAQRRTLSETSILFAWQDFPESPNENMAGERACRSPSLVLCELLREAEEKPLLFKTSRGELKL